MTDIVEKRGQCVADNGGCRWKIPAMTGLTLAATVSALCIMSTVWKHDWVLLAVSLCGPIALGAGVYLTLKSRADPGEDAVLTASLRDQSYRFVLILASVYWVTYGFFYGAVQLLLREGTGQR